MSFKLLKTASFVATIVVASVMGSQTALAETKAKNEVHWLKKCITNENSIKRCFVAEAIHVTNTKTKKRYQLASVRIESLSNSKRSTMYLQVPNRILLQSGLRIQIDEGKTRVAPFSICVSTACEAQVALNEAYINEMKKGNQLSLIYVNYNGKTVTLKMPLKGFTKGYDSKGVELDQASLPPELRNKPKKEAPAPLPLPATKQ